MKAVLVIGSNCSGRHEMMSRALRFLEKTVTLRQTSPVYESPDCLGSGIPYLNLVASIETELSEGFLISVCKDFEKACGRTDERKKAGIVDLDIDVVVWGSRVIRPADFSASYFKTGYASLDPLD